MTWEEDEERRVERLRKQEEREELKMSRMGIEREGFAKGGAERLFLEKHLGGEVKKDADGRGRQVAIGRKRKVH